MPDIRNASVVMGANGNRNLPAVTVSGEIWAGDPLVQVFSLSAVNFWTAFNNQPTAVQRRVIVYVMREFALRAAGMSSRFDKDED